MTLTVASLRMWTASNYVAVHEYFTSNAVDNWKYSQFFRSLGDQDVGQAEEIWRDSLTKLQQRPETPRYVHAACQHHLDGVKALEGGLELLALPEDHSDHTGTGGATTGSTVSKRPIVLSGPSGAGKSTLLKRLFADYPDRFGFSVSHTTRRPRDQEQDGVHYNFVDLEMFQKGIREKEFVEWAKFSDNHYGTTFQAIRSVNDQGKICILDIDMQGVKQVKETNLNPYYISIQPPSIEELEVRLRGRGSEMEDAIQKRLAAAQEELDYAKEEGVYDEIIINGDFETAYAQLKAFIDKGE
ncbi:hypothetical protein BGZ65_006123 [Modicella reniformis]|uniref:Guanylate kinase n=1 Tax=Modicella reniformis TaxID=1440133 RepID=A0A9P6SSQ7_9FUNG|nr:hypothetical protein BGZ65_006123 [Modicella reniformis]